MVRYCMSCLSKTESSHTEAAASPQSLHLPLPESTAVPGVLVLPSIVDHLGYVDW